MLKNIFLNVLQLCIPFPQEQRKDPEQAEFSL